MQKKISPTYQIFILKKIQEQMNSVAFLSPPHHKPQEISSKPYVRAFSKDGWLFLLMGHVMRNGRVKIS